MTTLLGTRPQQEVDPLGIGGTASNCLWKARTGGKQYFLQIAFFNGITHYEESDKFGSTNLAGFGDKGFIKKGDLGGVSPSAHGAVRHWTAVRYALQGLVVGTCSGSEPRERARQQFYAFRLWSGGASVTRQRIDLSQETVFDSPAVSARPAQPVRFVQRTHTFERPVQTGWTASGRDTHVAEAGRNERVVEHFHQSAS